MKKLFSALAFIFLIPITAFATIDNKIPENIIIQVNFNYQKDNHTDQLIIKDNQKIATNNHEWTLIQTQQPANDNHLILLSKLNKADHTQIMMSFLVIDTGKNPIIVSKPELIVRYGQKGEINLAGKNEKIQLTVLVDSLIDIKSTSQT
jgi:hypothetical protein